MRSRGFTLIELMVVLAIVIILAIIVALVAVAIPAYQKLKPGQSSAAPVGTSASVTVVPAEQPKFRCDGGFLTQHDGQVITEDGVAVRC